MVSDTKESASNAGDPGLITESGRSPREGDGNPLHCSWKSHGQRSLAGYSPCGSKESDMTEQLTLLHVHIEKEGVPNFCFSTDALPLEQESKLHFHSWCPTTRPSQGKHCPGRSAEGNGIAQLFWSNTTRIQQDLNFHHSRKISKSRQGNKTCAQGGGREFNGHMNSTYLWLSHVWQKLTQYCKAIILPLKKKKKYITKGPSLSA